ncbi:hypothetical protein LI177_00825 [bacterium 210820-DFI.6.37]|nr:hypothetical protein [bacterium 210820-DFI.6.37]
MKQKTDSRYIHLVAVIALLMGVLVIRLFFLTVSQNEKWSRAAEELSVKTIYESAPRGRILDRNGKVLAGNTYTASVRLNQGELSDEELNETIEKLVHLLEQNGDTLWGSFPLEVSGSQCRFQSEADKEGFLKNYGLSEYLNASQAFSKLKNYFKIKNTLSAKEAVQVMTVRNQMKELGYKKYMPVTVSKGVSDRTIAVLEENSSEYPGVEVFSEVSRSYPNGNAASHILGYLGKISDSEKETYVDKLGYQSWDMVGKDGIEKTYEEVLHGTDGQRKVQVNAAGELVKTISETEAKKGGDVTLTIDLDLQQTAEEALEQALTAMRQGGTFVSQYGNYTMKCAANAQVGAVVALDVKTGEVLAMASYPDFDPNLFVNGISTEDWESLQSSNPRDPLAPAPLYNVAAKSAVQPGSTFKMVTATAAIQCGLDPEQRLYDNGFVQLGNKSFGCAFWNLSHKKHGYLNLKEALGVSCNYYFFDAATGTDFYTGNSLGYKKEISIDTIMDYAAQYGLGQPTGVEIPETVTGTPSKESKIQGLAASLKNVLLAEAETYFQRSAIDDRDALNQSISTITGWIGQQLTKQQVEEKLKDVPGIKEEKRSQLADLCKYTYIDQATWNTADALNIAIGQGINAYTPLQMAGYTATLGNKGIRNPISLVEKIDGRGKIDKEPQTKVEVEDDSCFDYIIEGMVQAAQGEGGSLTSLFGNFPVTVAGKSGTAQRSGKINPPDEEEYLKSHLGAIAPYLSWDDIQAEKERLMETYPDIYTSRHKAVRRAVINLSGGRVTAETMDQFKDDYDNFAWVVTMAPAENPEIAVAVMIAQGDTASNAGPVAREVMGKYFQLKEN